MDTAKIRLNKLFVGGIPLETTETELREHFGAYGQIIDLIIIKDKQTKKSRGFGFVTFKDKKAMDTAIKEIKPLKSKTLDIKIAEPKKVSKVEENADVSQIRKVFIGGIPKEVTEESFREHFSKYGPIEDIVLIEDKATKEPRGFGFVTYSDTESIQRVMDDYSNHCLEGKWVECKLALPKSALSNEEEGTPRMSQTQSIPSSFNTPSIRRGGFSSHKQPINNIGMSNNRYADNSIVYYGNFVEAPQRPPVYHPNSGGPQYQQPNGSIGLSQSHSNYQRAPAQQPFGYNVSMSYYGDPLMSPEVSNSRGYGHHPNLSNGLRMNKLKRFDAQRSPQTFGALRSPQVSELPASSAHRSRLDQEGGQRAQDLSSVPTDQTPNSKRTKIRLGHEEPGDEAFDLSYPSPCPPRTWKASEKHLKSLTNSTICEKEVVIRKTRNRNNEEKNQENIAHHRISEESPIENSSVSEEEVSEFEKDNDESPEKFDTFDKSRSKEVFFPEEEASVGKTQLNQVQLSSPVLIGYKSTPSSKDVTSSATQQPAEAN